MTTAHHIDCTNAAAPLPPTSDDQLIRARFALGTIAWRDIARIRFLDAPPACEAAYISALIALGKFVPRGTRQAAPTGHFAASCVHPCCEAPSHRRSEHWRHLHGHSATIEHLCHDFGVPASIRGVRELSRVLQGSGVLGLPAFQHIESRLVFAVMAEAIEMAWHQLMDGAERGLKWTRHPDFAAVIAQLREETMRRVIDRTEAPPEAPSKPSRRPRRV